MTLPIPKEVAATIQDFIDQSEDSTVLLAAVPTLQPPPNSVYSRWASVSRVVRLVKPRNGSQTYGVALHALRRAYLPTAFSDEPLSFHPMYYSEEDDQLLDLEAVEKFRQRAGQLLDRLARDATQQLQKANFRRTAAILQDSNDSQLPLMADLIVAKINAEFEDKLGAFPSPILSVVTYIHFWQLSCLVQTRAHDCHLRATFLPRSFLFQRSRRGLLHQSTKVYRSSRRNSSYANNWSPFRGSFSHYTAIPLPLIQTPRAEVNSMTTRNKMRTIWPRLDKRSKLWLWAARSGRWV